MNLYIVRHSDALAVGEAGVTSDGERTLSPPGREKASRVAKGLKAVDCRPEVIACSPLPRALETARILAEALCPDTAPEACDFLRPGATMDALMDWLRTRSAKCALIVGHAPDVTYIASRILSGNDELDIHFETATVCHITFEDEPRLGCGCLEWLMRSEHLG